MRASLKSLLLMGICGLTLGTVSGSGSAATVGYYEMTSGSGQPYQVAPIVAAGGTPVQLFDLTAADLAGLDVLYVLNPSNGGYGAEYVSNLANIQTAVANGLVLIIHDRFVAIAETILPGGSTFVINRNTSSDTANVEILDNTTLVTNGPGGVLTNTSLDGGNLSTHGFTVAGSLPGVATEILGRTSPNEIVDFCYPFDRGAVYYSTIPLDFYLQGGGNNPPQDNMRDVYAPNVIAYGIDGACNPNTPPDCSGATASPSTIWPPNHKMVPISIAGVTDPDGDVVTISATGVRQDEVVRGNGVGTGNTAPDATLSPLAVRAERNGNPGSPGDGRVYHISFEAVDGNGGSCTGTVTVCVPHDQRPGATCIDGGPLYDSLAP